MWIAECGIEDSEQQSEDRGQRTDDRSQITDGRRQRTDDRGIDKRENTYHGMTRSFTEENPKKKAGTVLALPFLGKFYWDWEVSK